MPTSKHRKNRSLKTAHRPTKTAEIAPTTPLPTPILPPDPPPALLGLAETSGNEREIDFFSLSPRQQAALPIVACFPAIAQAARAADVGYSTLRVTEHEDLRSDLDNLQNAINNLHQPT